MASQGPQRDPKSRASLLSRDGRSHAVETSRTSDLDNFGVIHLQRQIMKEQDADLAGLEATVLSTKHIALAVNEELDLHTRLLDDIDQDADATTNRLRMVAQKKLGLVSQRAGKSCSMMVMCLLVVVIVFLLLLAFKLLI